MGNKIQLIGNFYVQLLVSITQIAPNKFAEF